jgi:glycosyltransferase involved in cell wall biosynthesis
VKFLIVTGIYPPDIGGPATFTVAFSKWLESHGHEFRILALWDQKKVQRFTEIVFFPRSRKKIFRFISVSWSVFKRLSNHDLLIATGLHEESAFALCLKNNKSIARIVGDPVWERAKNSNRTSLSLQDFQNSKLDLKSKFQRRLIVWSLNRYTMVTCPSLELCELVQKWGVNRPLRYIPNGVKISEIAQMTKEYDLIVVSRLVKWKNVEQVLEVARELNLKLLIVGDGPEMTSLQNKSKALRVNADFLGEIQHDKIKNLVQQSKIFIQVSSYEGLSFSLLQAMEAGTPCVISNIPGNLQVAQSGKEAMIVELDNRIELRESIQNILESPDLAAHLITCARARISEFFNEDIQFHKLVKELQSEL